MSIKALLLKILGRFGAETFTVNAYTGSGICYGTLDKATKTVRLHFYIRSSDPMVSGATMFVIPSAYRPSAQKTGACYIYTSSNARSFAYYFILGADGNIKQGFSNYVTEMFGICEYNLGG